jgi:hypothetical protein
VLVATRQKDLEALIGRIHPESRSQLVLLQNGFLEPLLERLGVPTPTLGVLYLAATDRSTPPRASWPSVFWGPHAHAVAQALKAGGIEAREAQTMEDFRCEQAIKLLWLSVVAAGSAAYKLPVEAVVERAEARELLEALLPAARRVYPCGLESARAWAGLVGYSRAIAGYRGSGTELYERNLLLFRYGATQAVHRKLLELLGVSAETLDTPSG